mgnify:CR=1 FL=1
MIARVRLSGFLVLFFKSYYKCRFFIVFGQFLIFCKFAISNFTIFGVNLRFGPRYLLFGKKQICVLNEVDIFCGILSKDKLVEKIGNQSIDCKIEKNKDQFNRLLGECFLDNESLSVYMVKNGYAFDYPKYSKGKFSAYEKYAKNLSLGLWQMKFEYPWIWRKKNR